MKGKPRFKKSDPAPKLILEEIIGLTTKNANGLAANVSSGDCVYLAGCAVVVYNPESGTQRHLLVSSRAPKPLSCVSLLCRDGVSYIAAGESGHQPAVLIWDYSTRVVLAEFKGHRYGVACIDFSPDGKHLVSIGFPNDGYLCIWDWRSGRLVNKLKASTSCSAISTVTFSSDGSFVVTAGKKHLKLWTLELSTKPRPNAGTGLMTIDGKPADLGDHKGSSFVSVLSSAWKPRVVGGERAVDPYPIYALTDAGILCLLYARFSVRKWVDLKVQRGFAISASDKLIACACNNGIVQLFTVETLKHVGSLQNFETEEHHPMTVLSSQAKLSKNGLPRDAATLPDTIACQFSTSEKLVVVYGDHSIYIWNVHDIPKVSRSCVLASHSACIWDVKSLPCRNLHGSALACVAGGGGCVIPFATCSADGTIRLWELAQQSNSGMKNAEPEIVINEQLSCSLDTKEVGTIHIVNTGILDQDATVSGVGAQGFRAMAITSDAEYLAAGDCNGSLHLYNLCTSDYTCFQEVHDAEILSLSFSSTRQAEVSTCLQSEPHYLLASGGRDQIIHVYDIQRMFNPIGSFDDHSAAVTSLKFTCNSCILISCSADKTVRFRDVSITSGGCNILQCHHQVVCHGAVYDMAIDPAMEVAVTVGQDKKINMFNLKSGKLVRAFKQDSDFGEPIKVTIDPSGTYFACSYSNRSFSIYNFHSGDLVTQAMGHAEVITGLIFLPDCKHIITVGGDSCIFIWKMPPLLSSAISQKIMEQASSLSAISLSQAIAPNKGMSHEDASFKNFFVVEHSNQNVEVATEGRCEEISPFKFSISRLPKWAQTKVTNEETSHAGPESILCQDNCQQRQSEIPLSMARYSEASATMTPAVVSTACELNQGNSRVCLANTSESPFTTDADASQSSAMDPKVSRSFNMDERWRTIHTVCFDLLDSPEVRDIVEVKVPSCVPELSKDSVRNGAYSLEEQDTMLGDFPIKDHILMEPCFEIGGEAEGLPSINGNASVEGLCSEASEIPNQTTKDDESSDKQYESDDLFSQHFSCLSTAPKVQRRRSSARQSFSACFVVSRNHPSGSKRLFETSAENLGPKTSNFFVETARQTLPGDVSTSLSKEPEILNICSQDGEKSQNTLGTCGPEESNLINHITRCHMLDRSKIENGDQSNFIPDEKKIEERITECRAALVSLDTTAENALQLFMKSGFPVSGEEASSRPASELSDVVSELLPQIIRKVRMLAGLLQSSKANSNLDDRAGASKFEPLVGRFADNLSHQPLELVRKNL